MNFLYLIIISPIETIVDWVFNFILSKASFVGVMGAVLGVSLAINFLALPLYNVADSLQEKERKIARRMENRVNRIKKAFKGDERFMMLSTYYRENNYHPLYVLRSSLSILIEIPFFIAAYHYLSHSELLRGASFWIFKDLGSPDNFISFGMFQIHVLPILMTAINFVSGAIYLKDAPFREKAQLYGIALVFLVLLYNSPSGLVIYWILNNIFSLVKNIVMKMKNPEKILHGVISALFIFASLFFFTREGSLLKKVFVLIFSLIIVFLPLIGKKCSGFGGKILLPENNIFLLVVSGLASALLCGFLLPSSVIATSPAEFSFLGDTDSPLSYVWSSLFVFTGFFVFWPIAIYRLFGKKVRTIIPALFFTVFLCAITNSFLFNCNYGDINVNFELWDSSILMDVPKYYFICSVLVFLASFSLYFISVRFKFQKILSFVMVSFCIAEFGISFMKIGFIKKSFEEYAASTAQTREYAKSSKVEPVYNFSRNGKNVVVLFFDRAISSFLPHILEQFPEMKSQFSGFTFYPNCISFGVHTVHAFPALAGGYEYTQEELNKRPDELLMDKHNESLLVMPKLFLDAGYDVTFTDPPLANYQLKGDYTPFIPYPQIHISREYRRNIKKYRENRTDENSLPIDNYCRKNIRNFSVIQVLNPMLRQIFYRGCIQEISIFRFSLFEEEFAELYYLPEKTVFENERNTFTFIANETTHNPVLLSYPDFCTPSTKAEKKTSGVYEPYSKDFAIEEDYDANVSALKQTAKWLDYLKENGVYDNTRIIIVSDHGLYREYETFSNFEKPDVPSSYNPLFMVKDFDSKGEVKTDDSFITNADTLFFVKENLPLSDYNPFTKNKFVQKKGGFNVYPSGFENEHNTNYLTGKTEFVLDKNRAFHVSENIFDPKNWIPLSEWEKQKER